MVQPLVCSSLPRSSVREVPLHEPILRIERGDVAFGDLDWAVRAVGMQSLRTPRVAEDAREHHVPDVVGNAAVVNGGQDLDAAVEVAFREVGAARRPAMMEPEDPRVLVESTRRALLQQR